MPRNPGSLRAEKTRLTLERDQRAKLKNRMLKIVEDEDATDRDAIAAVRLLYEYSMTKPSSELEVDGDVGWALKLK